MLDPMIGDVQAFWIDLATALPFIVAIHLISNALAGAYGRVWEYASTNEAVRLVAANGGASATILVLAWVVRDQIGVVIPFSTLVVGGLLSFLIMGLVRFRSRLFSFRQQTEGPSILVVGSSSEAAAFAHRAGEIEGGGRVVGFVNGHNGSPSSVRLLADLPILGSLEDIAAVVQDEEVDQLVVVGGDPDLVRDVVDRCLEIDVRLRILPGVQSVMEDERAPLDLRDIKVEDLLVREL
ncbi:MAG: nucleoside-diphosphate sugar epimerase/dehydratase, partial [Pirellulales bacterium]